MGGLGTLLAWPSQAGAVSWKAESPLDQLGCQEAGLPRVVGTPWDMCAGCRKGERQGTQQRLLCLGYQRVTVAWDWDHRVTS